MDDSDEELLKSQFFFNYANNLNSITFQVSNRLYNKIKDLTAIVMALLPILFGLSYYFLDNSKFRPLLFPISLALSSLAIAVLAGFIILWNNEFIYNDPLALIQEYHKESISFITLKTASSLADVVNANVGEHNKLGDRYQIMIVFVAVGILILMITFWMAIL